MTSAADEAQLAAYIEAFNRSDYDRLRGFYHDDVRLVIGSGHELVGPEAIIDFYRGVKSKTQRTITILRSFSNGETVAAEIESEFLAMEDVADFTSGPMAKGDRLYLNSFVFYDLRDGRYALIRAAVHRREWRRVG